MLILKSFQHIFYVLTITKGGEFETVSFNNNIGGVRLQLRYGAYLQWWRYGGGV